MSLSRKTLVAIRDALNEASGWAPNDADAIALSLLAIDVHRHLQGDERRKAAARAKNGGAT